MERILSVNKTINDIVWGMPVMILIFGTGVLSSVMCGFPQFTRFGRVMGSTFGALKRTKSKHGSVSPFKAMCTALAASMGTGNIAGVSGAIAIGGPGAVFWMWVSALLGMGTKFAEVTLAVCYREKNAAGDWVGGPMYYIRNGLGRMWDWLGALFCLFGGLAAFGIGNMAQVNTVAQAVNEAVSGFISTTERQQQTIAFIVGIACAVIVSFVVFGGIRRIGDVCALMVPVMAAVYIVCALIVIAGNIVRVPDALRAILVGAFDPGAVAGGLTGVGIRTVITMGMGRGIFSNEAGLGSAPIAHAAADVEHPVEQGLYGVFEVFLDTIVICTMTALVVLLGVGVENIEFGKDVGAALTISGFRSVFSGALPGVLVAASLALFALPTVLTWGLYGGRCCEYLFGEGAAKVYQVVFCAFVIVGATMELSSVWAIADTLNGLMALPNLVALISLSPLVAKLSREYFQKPRSHVSSRSRERKRSTTPSISQRTPPAISAVRGAPVSCCVMEEKSTPHHMGKE